MNTIKQILFIIYILGIALLAYMAHCKGAGVETGGIIIAILGWPGACKALKQSDKLNHIKQEHDYES